MKRIFIFFILIVVMFFLDGCANKNDEYLRIHIRANSNLESDQNIKYFIKDVLVEYMSPRLNNVKSKDEAISVFYQNKENLTNLINDILDENGYSYFCSIDINNEFFPTRNYGDMVLNAGYYDALIVKLGSGSGNNWWCVMYPNLCFNKPNNVVYKSKIMEIIEKIKG